MNYNEFLKTKELKVVDTGFDAYELDEYLFDFQRDIVKWATKKGKCALFEECGLGKTIQQLEWANQICKHTNGNVLIFAPLAVSQQTKNEGIKFGFDVNICRTQQDVKKGINITNYEMMEHFNIDSFEGIVLDESSILKGFQRKYSTTLIESCKNIKYKLSCTATPAPNDFIELGMQAEWLGVMKRSEMLATYFVYDAGTSSTKWRLKKHALEEFWKWIASWAVVIRKPSDLGYEDKGFKLKKLNFYEHIVTNESKKAIYDGKQSLFNMPVKTLNDRRRARKDSLTQRVKVANDLVKTDIGNKWLVWCDLNAESESLSKAISNSVEVKGADKPKHKEDSMINFANGDIKVLISKPKIAGWGMNFQVCHNVIFVGLSDSYEAFYQAIRRCYRFGQLENVNVHIIISDVEGTVKANIERKERDANMMFNEMVKYTKELLTQAVHGTSKEYIEYIPTMEMDIPMWLVEEK